ncbi:MAG: hypothetical protein GOVbin4206_26 [Prokaryotic dsDNA virus sp.]|nr:MAG: hypothetical protein GOVbin4206_26 [Prokaryotic dsDNA virus sp.]
MNIFALSKCPVEAAQQMIDKHIVKMPTESCQMLHTNSLYFLFWNCHGREPSLKELKEFHKESHFSYMMKPAMLNHPSTIWARQNKANYMWLYNHALALCKEYTFRYGKIHGTEKRVLDSFTFSYEDEDLTPVTIAMADQYRIPQEKHTWEFVIKSYQQYYLEGKWKFASWKKNRTPTWWPKDQHKKMKNKEILRFNKLWNASLEMIK